MVLEESGCPAVSATEKTLRACNCLLEARELPIEWCRLELVWTHTDVHNVLRTKSVAAFLELLQFTYKLEDHVQLLF